ncbi:MAG: capsular biosynthesis protein [Rhodocyclaceae bacterium]|nr:capsular biosynthesis protein [Rhodocyclaceae bacterium]
MSRMIDLHCHFLPGVDDGAPTLAHAIDLARAAVADGIVAALMTPHVHPGRYDNRIVSLQDDLHRFKTALRDENVALEIYLGGEIRFSFESFEWILQGEVPFMGEVDGFRILLLEFPHQTIPVGSIQLVEKLIALRIRPMIAHPERNKMVMLEPERLGPFLDAGCWLQLTAGSLTGRFGPQVRSIAELIIRNGWAHILATDAHNLIHRPPYLAEGRAAVADLLGEKMAEVMVFERPAQILGRL